MVRGGGERGDAPRRIQRGIGLHSNEIQGDLSA